MIDKKYYCIWYNGQLGVDGAGGVGRGEERTKVNFRLKIVIMHNKFTFRVISYEFIHLIKLP